MALHPSWPPLLRAVPWTGRCKTRRKLSNACGHIPAGRSGTFERGSSWNRFVFKADGCECCGVQLRISHVSALDLELIP